MISESYNKKYNKAFTMPMPGQKKLIFSPQFFPKNCHSNYLVLLSIFLREGFD